MNEVGKVSIVSVLITSLVFGIWLYIGAPRVWENPSIPPEIQETTADTTNKTFLFASDVEAWSGTAGNANTTLSWSSADGCPSTGSLQTRAYKTGGGATTSSNYWQWTGTWENLGIPAGSAITEVRGGYQYKVTAYGANTSQTGPLEFRVGAGCALEATLLASASIIGTVTTCADRGQGSNVSVPSEYQASNSTVCFRLNSTSNLAGGEREIIIFEDTIALAITYSEPIPAFSQAAFRFYEDGIESDSLPVDVQNTDINRDTSDGDSNLQLRLRIQETNGVSGSATDDFQLQYSKNSGTWTNVTTTSSNVKGFDSTNLTHGNSTTERLTGGSGSFVSGEISEIGLIEDHQITASNFTEYLYSLTLVSADLNHNDTLDFRVLRNGEVITYGVTPTITVQAAVYSVTITYPEPPEIDYNTMPMDATRDSGTITAEVGNANTKLNIKGADAVYEELGKCGDGICTWTLVSSIGNADEYVHAFTKYLTLNSGEILGSDPSTEWVALNTSGSQVLTANVEAYGSQDFKLDMRTPYTGGAETDVGSQYTTEITIIASASE